MGTRVQLQHRRRHRDHLSKIDDTLIGANATRVPTRRDVAVDSAILRSHLNGAVNLRLMFTPQTVDVDSAASGDSNNNNIRSSSSINNDRDSRAGNR